MDLADLVRAGLILQRVSGRLGDGNANTGMTMRITTKPFAIAVGAAVAAWMLNVQAQAPATKPAPAPEPEVAAKGIADDPYGAANRAKGVPAGAKAKGYSPYAGRNYPTRVFFGDTHNHTTNSGDGFAAGTRLDADGEIGDRALRLRAPQALGVDRHLAERVVFDARCRHAAMLHPEK